MAGFEAGPFQPISGPPHWGCGLDREWRGFLFPIRVIRAIRGSLGWFGHATSTSLSSFRRRWAVMAGQASSLGSSSPKSWCASAFAKVTADRLPRPPRLQARLCAEGESQRDSGPLPKVAPPSRRSGAIPPSPLASARSRRSEAETEARREGGRHELPWENRPGGCQPQRGCVSAATTNAATPFGLITILPELPRVASQSWAEGHNPFAIAC